MPVLSLKGPCMFSCSSAIAMRAKCPGYSHPRRRMGDIGAELSPLSSSWVSQLSTNPETVSYINASRCTLIEICGCLLRSIL